MTMHGIRGPEKPSKLSPIPENSPAVSVKATLQRGADLASLGAALHSDGVEQVDHLSWYPTNESGYPELHMTLRQMGIATAKWLDEWAYRSTLSEES
jgi:hypothetical protein